jgi:GMP synthase (glutamine-hydrolysing)
MEADGYSGQVVALRTVGVQGDARSYRYLGILHGRALDAEWRRLSEIGTRIPGKLDFVNRVAYVLNRQRVDGRIPVHSMTIDRESLDLLRELDAVVRGHLDKPPISQVFAVLLPIGVGGKCSVAIRTFITNDYMTGRIAVMDEDVPLSTVEKLVADIGERFPEIDLILYDVTGKPPATVEWE